MLRPRLTSASFVPLAALAALAAFAAFTAPAHADDSIVTTAFVPLGDHGDASIASGYDTASANLTVHATGEARLARWLALRAGVEATTAPDRQRPFVGVRARLLDEGADGVDGWLGLAYQQDGIRPGEGRLEVSTWFARGGLRAQLAYAQDEENDDRQADVQLAALHAFADRFHAGVGARLRTDLWSDDEKRRPGEPDLEAVVGPVADVTLGAFVVFGQVGASAVRVDTLDVGVLAVGGVGATF
jgi:hypothetical protein